MDGDSDKWIETGMDGWRLGWMDEDSDDGQILGWMDRDCDGWIVAVINGWTLGWMMGTGMDGYGLGWTDEDSDNGQRQGWTMETGMMDGSGILLGQGALLTRLDGFPVHSEQLQPLHQNLGSSGTSTGWVAFPVGQNWTSDVSLE